MMNRRRFLAALAAAASSGQILAAQSPQVDVYLDPN